MSPSRSTWPSTALTAAARPITPGQLPDGSWAVALFNRSDVTAIKASITKYAASRIGSAYPTSIESAKFSMPYVAAYTALYGAPMLKAFTEEAIRDEAVNVFDGLAIKPVFDEPLSDSVVQTHSYGTDIELIRRDGRKYRPPLESP